MSSDGLFSPNWRGTLIASSATLHDALKAITESGLLMACLIDSDGMLEGIVTDADVRRALLRGASLEAPIGPHLNQKPTRGPFNGTPGELARLARKCGIREVPLVDAEGRLRDIFILSLREFRTTLAAAGQATAPTLPNAMFILAGGLGTRLSSVVQDRPKPLAIVGDKPILQTLIERAVAAGIRRFYVAVNYMAERLEEHLADPGYAGLDIRIVRERSRLGTAGSIGYVKDEIDVPILVCNADVLTTVPFDKILDHHAREGADATCVVRPYHVAVPFGVVEIEKERVIGIKEKPDFVHLVNTGIYVLAPATCALIERDRPLDMPDLIKSMLASERKIVPFLQHEYWIDIGRPEDYRRANEEFQDHFKE